MRHDDSAHVPGKREVEVSACATGSREGGEWGGKTAGTAVETARFPGMPRGGGVGSNEFE